MDCFLNMCYFYHNAEPLMPNQEDLSSAPITMEQTCNPCSKENKWRLEASWGLLASSL